MPKTQNAPKRERFVSRRVFALAVAISLLIHLAVAGYLHLPFSRPAEEEAAPLKIQIAHIERMRPPTPQPSVAPTPLVHARIAPPVISKTRGAAPSRHVATLPLPQRTPAAVRRTATPAPTSIPSAQGVCAARKNAQPAVESTPDVGDIPREVRAAKVTGTAQINVSLDEQGRVTATAVAQSSGNAGLDAFAAQLARQATYSPKYVDCKPVAGAFVFSVHFSAL